VVGIVVNLNLVFFYGAPLSTIWTVLAQKNTDSIHIPTMVTNTMNGTFWLAYGLAVKDYFIFVPNGLGTILGGIQILLLILFPRTATTSKSKQNQQNSDEELGNNDDDIKPPRDVSDQTVPNEAAIVELKQQ
jgi:uncharacterized protein with PQ loop repeat